MGAQNELDFCSGSGDLAPAAHIGLRQRGCCRIARAGSDGGCIRNPFDSAPPRSYDAAGRGGNSVKLNWGTCSVGCDKKLITRGRRTRVAGIIFTSPTYDPTGGQIVPQLKKYFAHFLCSRELLVKLASLHRKYVTQKENKGTLCPPMVKTTYVKVYLCTSPVLASVDTWILHNNNSI